MRTSEHEDSTREGYEGYIARTILPALGEVPINKLTARMLEGFYAELRRCRVRCDRRLFIEHKKSGEHNCKTAKCAPHVCKPMAASTVRQIHSIISGTLNAAVRWDWISANLTKVAQRPKQKPAQPDPPSPAVAAQLMEAAFNMDDDWGTLVWLARISTQLHPQGEELDAACVEFAEHRLGGDLLVHDQHVGVGAAEVFPVVAGGDDLAGLGGLGEVGVGVDEPQVSGLLRFLRTFVDAAGRDEAPFASMQQSRSTDPSRTPTQSATATPTPARSSADASTRRDLTLAGCSTTPGPKDRWLARLRTIKAAARLPRSATQTATVGLSKRSPPAFRAGDPGPIIADSVAGPTVVTGGLPDARDL